MTSRCICFLLSLLCLFALAGCESPNGLKGLESANPFWSKPNLHGQEEKYRKEYQTNRNRKAMRWLLANRIESGMSLGDVNAVLGEQGIYDETAGFLKRGNAYRVDDKVFHFGPDDHGQAVYLIFRENKLVNFEPERYADRKSLKSEDSL